MKKRPFLMALLVLGAIFLFFLMAVYFIAGFTGGASSLALGEKVGVIEVKGVIVSSRNTIDQLIRFKEDQSIKAIVIRVDSPGGGVGPSQEIFREVSKTSEMKPVVVSMGAVAASGGYYIAAPARRIFANPGTITGSIGVIMEFTNWQELLDKLGLKSQVVKSGRYKDIGSPVRPMSKEDRELLQDLIDDVHHQFIDAIALGRNMPGDKVRSLADGRIFTGRQALDAGLVDELGNLQDAIAVAAQMGGIEGKPKVVYPPQEKGKLFDYLIEETASSLRRGFQESTSSGLQYLWSGIE
jgi:protease-4